MPTSRTRTLTAGPVPLLTAVAALVPTPVPAAATGSALPRRPAGPPTRTVATC